VQSKHKNECLHFYHVPCTYTNKKVPLKCTKIKFKKIATNLTYEYLLEKNQKKNLNFKKKPKVDFKKKQ
jgi:hypothetical protein